LIAVDREGYKQMVREGEYDGNMHMHINGKMRLAETEHGGGVDRVE
jgi:hypothetical protein